MTGGQLLQALQPQVRASVCEVLVDRAARAWADADAHAAGGGQHGSDSKAEGDEIMGWLAQACAGPGKQGADFARSLPLSALRQVAPVLGAAGVALPPDVLLLARAAGPPQH